MLYDLECDCGERSEHNLLMDDIDKWVECPSCGGQICRRHHRIYTPPMIQGDTVAGGYDHSGYDIGLGEYVKNKAHRKDLMEQKGLDFYSPDPEIKKHRDEVRHIMNNSNPDDAQAVAAIQKEHKTADNKRRSRIVSKSLEGSLKSITAD